ncbi:MAG: MgtC/SapB family protein [Burkholderiales bacterium]|nr:MgtC/SapB family protein [Burkholderiales bacterium]
MNAWFTPELKPLAAFLTSLALGLLIGLERERSPAARAGLRTFALVALAGTLGAMLAQESGAPWVLGAGLIILGGMMVATYFKQPLEADPGTTTIAAIVVCYGLGAIVWYGHVQLAVALAVTTAVLLYFKAELRGALQRLTRQDLVSMLQFAVLSLVILPVLPDRGFGPYAALNPYQIWWMVVLVSGLSLAGYAALRLAGERHGALLTGLFGGVASSTATTLTFARHGRQPELTAVAALVILTANWVVLVRLTLLVAVLAPALLPQAARMLGLAALAGVPLLYLGWRRLERGELPALALGNPTEIRAALGFGALYAAVLFAAAWLADWAGSRGVYAVALVSGLTDVDAITLSSLRLYNLGSLTGHQGLTAILLALMANVAFKAGLTLAIGGPRLLLRVLPGFTAVALGAAIGWSLV